MDLYGEKAYWERVFDNCRIIEAAATDDVSFFEGKIEKFKEAEACLKRLSSSAQEAANCFANGACYCGTTSNSAFLTKMSEAAINCITSLIEPVKATMEKNKSVASGIMTVAKDRKLKAKARIKAIERQIAALEGGN